MTSNDIKIVYLQGIAMWCELRVPEPKYETYRLNLYLDDKNLSAYKKSGMQLKLNKDERGTFVRLKRNSTRTINDEIKHVGPPTLFDKNDVPLPEDVDIGNGSVVTCKIRVYPTTKGYGSSLEGVRADELKPYKRPTVVKDSDVNPF